MERRVEKMKIPNVVAEAITSLLKDYRNRSDSTRSFEAAMMALKINITPETYEFCIALETMLQLTHGIAMQHFKNKTWRRRQRMARLEKAAKVG